MATPAEQDLVVTRGDTLTVNVVMTTDGTTPINITGRVYTSQVRQFPDDPTTSGSFVCTITDGAAGELQLVMAASTTAAMDSGNYYWDLQENASGVISTVLAGAFVVLADVTRA